MMGLLDCVASPEGRNRFDENQRPIERPRDLSRSDHDISRRRGLPLFASQSNLKNIRDKDFWRHRVLRFLYSPEGREDIRILRIPFNQLGYNSITDFIADIPQEIFLDYQNQPPPDESLLKEYKVFWVRDGIGESGTFKWQGVIENESCFGLQLDRKRAVPYGIHDGKGLFYCKPGHRAIVPEYEIVPYKKFLRGFLGLPPRKDSLLALGEAVRLSARAIRAKNSKPGDRVYLPKEKKWATVQWIGKIGNETVVDLVYERPKPQAGQAVSPDEPCISRSMSLADFIGELASEPNSPIGLQAPSQEKDNQTVPVTPTGKSATLLPQTPTSPKENQVEPPKSISDDESHGSSEDDEDLTDSDQSEDNSEEETEDESDVDEEEQYKSDDSEENTMLARTKEVDDIMKEPEDKMEMFLEEEKIKSPKRKGFFGFTSKTKKSMSLPSVHKEKELKEKNKSETELRQRSPKPPRSKSPNIFANFKLRKNVPKKQKQYHEPKDDGSLENVNDIERAPEPEKESPPEKFAKKQKGKSQWSGFGIFKSKSKGSLSKLTIVDDPNFRQDECSTPVDKMIPPDKIPTPPPNEGKASLKSLKKKKYNERLVDRPDNLELERSLNDDLPAANPPPPEQPVSEAEKQRGEVRLDSESESQSSESDVDGSVFEDERERDEKEETTRVQLHYPATAQKNKDRSSSDSSDGAKKVDAIMNEASENGGHDRDFPVYLAICPPYIPPEQQQSDEREDASPSPPPIPSSPPPPLDDVGDELEIKPMISVPFTPSPPTPVTPTPPIQKAIAPTTPVTEQQTVAPTTPLPETSSPPVQQTGAPTTPVTPSPPVQQTVAPTTPVTPSPPVQQNVVLPAPVPSLERFKESKVRNRPSSFGSFLARIKNQKKVPGEVLKYPEEDHSPPPTSPTPPPPQTTGTGSGNSSDNEDDDQSEHLEASLPKEPGVDASKEENEKLPSSPNPIASINRSLVKPKKEIAKTTPAASTEGDQDGITLELLDVKETSQPFESPPPVPSEETPTPKPKSRTFSFGFSKKRKSSQSQAPPTPDPVALETSDNDERQMNNDNAENIDPATPTTPTITSDVEEKERGRKQSKGSSFRSSFRRTFSLTRNKNKRNSSDGESTTAENPKSPRGNEITKPRPVTMYIDNNDLVEQKQKKNSFRKKRPTSVIVDIKPWNARHGGSEDVDIYSSPSSDEPPKSPSMLPKSPNPALLPNVEIVDIPKHRIFTTPAFFQRKQKKEEEGPLIPKASQTKYSKFSFVNIDGQSPKGSSQVVTAPPAPTPTKKTPPPLPTSPPRLPSSPPPIITEAVVKRPKSSSIDSQSSPETHRTRLKSALKQRKEIESIPKGLKVNDRVLWYSSQGPIPGTVQRLFKDGTDKYTAMVKFDREVKDAPLRLIREGDAFIVTVEELITPDMFEPKPSPPPLQEERERAASPPMPPSTPGTPSVRFNEGYRYSSDEDDEHDMPPPFQEEEVQMACGFRRGIQCRDDSCCLESILFSLFYTTNAFDICMLYGNSTGEDTLTRSVRKIMRKEIVDPLRREGFVSWHAVKKLRDAVKPLSEEWQTMSTDAEVMMFILFDRALKLGKFLSYSNDMSDFLHQLVVDPKDLSRSTTVQHLFETSLNLMDKLKLRTVPTPALILEMPRSNDKLMQYRAVIPNLSLIVSHLLQDGPRLCICGVVAQYDCAQCSKNVGRMSIVYCDNCKGTADIIHFQLPHQAELSPLNQPVVILDLAAIICVKKGHYISFVKCGNQRLSPWVYFDGAEIENPKVCIEQNLGMWLDRLEKYPGKFQDALQYPLLTHILQDSHICIYQAREKSSSV